MPSIETLLEAERRGILPEDKKPLLEEARKRGLVPPSPSAAAPEKVETDKSPVYDQPLSPESARLLSPIARPALETGGLALGERFGGPRGAGLAFGIGRQTANLLDEYGGVTEKPAPIFRSMAEWAGVKPASDSPLRNALVDPLLNTGEGALWGPFTEKVLTPAVRKAAEFGGKVLKPLIGRTTGAGVGAVQEAMDAGRRAAEAPVRPSMLPPRKTPLAESTEHVEDLKRAGLAIREKIAGMGENTSTFLKALRGKISGEDVVDKATGALSEMKDARGEDYRNGLKAIQEGLPWKSGDPVPTIPPPTKHGAWRGWKHEGELYGKQQYTYRNPGHPGDGVTVYVKEPQDLPGKITEKAKDFGYDFEDPAGMKSIDISPIIKKLKQLLPQYVRTKFDASGNMIPDWERTSFGRGNTEDLNKVKKIVEDVLNWGSKRGDRTPLGLDMLKRDLGSFYSESSEARTMVAQLEKTVKDVISDAVPQYGEMVKGYEKATRLIKDIEATLGMRKRGWTGQVAADHTLRRLTTAMKDDFELRRDLVRVLGKQGGEDLLESVAGYTLSPWIARGLAGTSPVLLGETVLAYRFLTPHLWPIVAVSSPRAMGEFLHVFARGLEESKAMVPLAAKAFGPQLDRRETRAAGRKQYEDAKAAIMGFSGWSAEEKARRLGELDKRAKANGDID